jgi:hypothetical protein
LRAGFIPLECGGLHRRLGKIPKLASLTNILRTKVRAPAIHRWLSRFAFPQRPLLPLDFVAQQLLRGPAAPVGPFRQRKQ